MTSDTEYGRSPDGSGSRPSDGAQEVSTVPASIPNAAEDRILSAVKRALATLNDPTMNWQEYHRRLQGAPDLVLYELREAQVLFRLPEQANWPLLIDAFVKRPYTLTIRTQLTIGGQTFAIDQQQDSLAFYKTVPRDLARHMARHAVRSVVEAVAEPYYERAAILFASAIEARSGETVKLGSTEGESAGPQDDARPQSVSGLSHTGGDRG